MIPELVNHLAVVLIPEEELMKFSYVGECEGALVL